MRCRNCGKHFIDDIDYEEHDCNGDDGRSFIASVAIGAVTNSAILGGLVGGDLLGGIIGDGLDGSLDD